MKEAIAAYNLASRIHRDDISVYAGRSEAKSSLNDLTGAKADLQRALELAEKQKEKISALLLRNDCKNLM